MSTSPRPGSADPIAPGVPHALAIGRAARVRHLHYALSLVIPASRTEPVRGTITIAFTMAGPCTPLALDFAPDNGSPRWRLFIDGRPIDAAWRNGHILIPAAALRTGANVLYIEFTAGEGPLHRRDDLVYTIFVPARAHEVFPCFDQPDMKARWTLTLDVPAGWDALGNGPAVRRTSHGGRTHVSFGETDPISTYLFAFAAGRLLVEEARRRGRTFRVVHLEPDRSTVQRNLDPIVELHADAIDWLERYTDIPYPFGKFDLLLVPSFQFGGMEHPGAIFYNARSLMLEASATQQQMLDRATLIAHETAHMWFGDLVTMTWFNDVWMKEVFANFLAARMVAPSFRGLDHDLRFLLTHYPAAYDVDRTAGTNAIRQPLDNLRDARDLYGAIVYHKAPIVMRQIEKRLGQDVFRDSVRAYLKTHAFSDAGWPDLVAQLETRAEIPLRAWSDAWVEESGRPEVSTELRIEEGRIAHLAFRQRDPDPTRERLWPQTLQVSLGYAEGIQSLPAQLDGPRTEVPGAVGRPAPLFVLPNGGGMGYGAFHLDPLSVAGLGTHLPEVPDPLTRGNAWVTLWDALLEGTVDASWFLSLVMRALPAERDEMNTQRILAYAIRAHWKFSADAERLARSVKFEHTLREGLNAAHATTLKAAYFRALRDVAESPDTVAWLVRVWAGDDTVPGLALAEPDWISLVEELALRAVPDPVSLVFRQVERTAHPEHKARLSFVAPALSPEPAVRDRFFASLAAPANRRREPWAIEGLRYLNHPLRAASSAPYIHPALCLLDDVRRTGDIFFPQRWIEATLWGHRSAEAAQAVRAFLDGTGFTCAPSIRRLVLASADELFRTRRQRTS